MQFRRPFRIRVTFSLRSWALVLAIALFPAVSSAQEVEEQTDENEIIVFGKRLPDTPAIAVAVEQISPAERKDEPLAKFADPLCVSVTGLGERYGAIVRAAIESRASSLGLSIADPDCTANALVIVVDDLPGLIARLKVARPGLVSLTASRDLAAALDRHDPVVSWWNEELRSQYGSKLPHSAAIPGLTLPMAVAAKINSQTRARRVDLNISAAIGSAVVAFELSSLDGVRLDQLSDYAAMRLLAPIQKALPWSDAMPASILSLFSAAPSQAQQGLTDFDRAYLQGLYTLPANASPRRLKASVLQAFQRSVDSDEE